MLASLDGKYMTPQEYLEWEEHQDIKYEYINGEVFAMTGGTIPHTTIALNLASALKSHLRGGSCRAWIICLFSDRPHTIIKEYLSKCVGVASRRHRFSLSVKMATM